MRNIFFSLLIIVISFTLMAQPNTTAQSRAELSVAKYVKEKFSNQNYKSYGFGDVLKVSPPEIEEIDYIKKEILPPPDSITKNYDSILKEKIAYVKANKLYSVYEIPHTFTLKKKYEQPVLYDFIFTLYPDGKVKNVTKVLAYKLTDSEHDYFYNYSREFSLVRIYNQETKAYNKSMYEYLHSLYDNEINDKAAAMSTILTTVEVLDKRDYYDSTLIAQQEVKKHFIKNYNIERLQKPTFTKLQPIKDSNEVIGYKLFVKQTINNNEVMHYFEFDNDYIIRNVLPLSPPFEQYFIKDE